MEGIPGEGGCGVNPDIERSRGIEDDSLSGMFGPINACGNVVASVLIASDAFRDLGMAIEKAMAVPPHHLNCRSTIKYAPDVDAWVIDDDRVITAMDLANLDWHRPRRYIKPKRGRRRARSMHKMRGRLA